MTIQSSHYDSGSQIDDNDLVIITTARNTHFDLSKKVDYSLKHESGYIIRYNEDFAEHRT